jgi:asparagine synthetase B (glutamine-hydrolysing)
VCLLLLVLLGGANHVQEGTNVGHVRIILGVVEDFMPRCVCLIAGVAKWIVVIIFIVCPTCVFTHVVNVLLIDIVLTDIIALIISSNGHSKYVVGAQSSGGVDSSAVRAHQDALRFIRNSELEVTMSTPSGGKFVCVLCLCD